MSRSAFFGINVGTQGLYTARTNLDITNHNIANAETDGYSRQYAIQSATDPMKNGQRGMIGTGSEVKTIEQYRDAYLDDKYWSIINDLGGYTTKNDALKQLETILNEPSDSGYSKFFTNIFNALDVLSGNAGDATARNNFVTSIDSFCEYIGDVGEKLIDVQKEMNFGIKTSVDQINVYADQLAAVNKQIGNLELGGDTANDLRDERNRILDQLSSIVNVDTKEMVDGNGAKTFSVTINGQILVSNDLTYKLEVKARETLSNPEDAVDLYDVYWASGNKLDLNNSSITGELKGYIDIRDGNNGENFNGDVVSIVDTAAEVSVTVENLSRTDLPQTGTVNVAGSIYYYNSYSYTPASAGPPVINESMTFNIGIPASVTTGTTASTEDVLGNTFNGTITTVDAGQVQISNTGNQDLTESGSINLNGEWVTYTGYTKSATAPYTITLDIDLPASAPGTQLEAGEDNSFKGVPYYISKLNEFVRTIAKDFNGLNESGNGGIPA